MAGYQNVLGSDWCALSFKIRSDLSGMGSSIGIEIKHFQARCKTLDGAAILSRARLLFRAVEQLVQDDGRNG